MNYSLHRLFFIITAVVSLALVTSPSYAKDEGDKKPKTSKVNKAKKDKAKKDKVEKKTSKKKEKKKTDKKEKPARSGSSKKDSDSDSRSNKSGEKATKPSRESDRGDSKESDDSRGKGDKDSKSDDSGSNKSGNKKSKRSSRSGSTTSKAKKQYKDIVVNLNKADAKTFSHYLVGIGEKRAKAIVAYRKTKGKFKDIKELLKVEGIGDKIFDGLKKNVSLSKGETSAPKDDKSASKKPKK